jgi:hypothetical protein
MFLLEGHANLTGDSKERGCLKSLIPFSFLTYKTTSSEGIF